MNSCSCIEADSGRDRRSRCSSRCRSGWRGCKELGEKGHIKDAGQPLERAGRSSPGRPKTVTDGPFAEAKDIVGGYTIVEAADLAHAVELSTGCPIFDVGGFVEVRPVMKMG